MRRGAYGKPWRPAADGWSVPRKAYLGGLYQHQRPALNGITAWQNNTQVELQPGQVGRPMTRPSGIGGCGDTPWDNGLPHAPWIGTGDGQYLPIQLANTFQQNGTNDFGRATRLHGFKNVQAMRQWHGALPWTSHDNSLCADSICNTLVNDGFGNAPGDPGYVTTYSSRRYEGPQPPPSQTKYLALTSSATLHIEETDSSALVGYVDSSASGSVSVNASSGEKTSTLSTSEDAYFSSFSTPKKQMRHIVNGAGWAYAGFEFGIPGSDASGTPVNYAKGMRTFLDGVAGADVHCGTPGYVTTLSDLVGEWNTNVPDHQLPPVSDSDNYSGSVSFDETFGPLTNHNAIAISWTRSATSFSWSYTQSNSQTSSDPDVDPSPVASDISFTGSLILSNPNSAASVRGDVTHLLSFWPLNDDALYPWRTDGIWQVAPLVTRDEYGGNISPTGFIPANMDDYRNPVTDANGNAPWSSINDPPPLGWYYAPNNNDASGRPPGDPEYSGAVSWNATWGQIPWQDPAAWGFRFPDGRDAGSAAALDLVQFALTGKVCGLPMPAAFTNTESLWYRAGFSDSGNFQNFFDFRAEVWKACTGDDGVDMYLYGYGEWLYDRIATTGAQLPHCATQWTNNADAFYKPAYAYLVQADSTTASGIHPEHPDALWAQKCCEIMELWPSQNFLRPAGADRFAADEAAVYCINHVTDGVTVFLDSNPAGITTSDIIGVTDAFMGDGNGGIYSVAAVDHVAFSVTVNTKLRPLPTGFALPSGDQDLCLWKVRWPSGPAILGRSAISGITDNGDGTCTITLVSPEVNLQTGDAIDTCSTAITYDGNGNRVSETMTVIASNKTVTRIDDSNFQITASLASLSGSVYIVSHGTTMSGSATPAWYWDDNGRKGDYAVYQWLHDYRTNQEVTRLSGVTDCDENEPPTGSPSSNSGYANTSALSVSGSGNLVWDANAFGADGAIAFRPCCASVVAITPNGETWQNGVVISFPSTFNFDERYGACWQCEIEQAMVDLLWQAPHSPCGFDDGTWSIDDGTCKEDDDGAEPPIHYYASWPLVEARITFPANGGNGQNEAAPALPAGISIGFSGPSALPPPGVIGFDGGTGNPSGTFTVWGYRIAIDQNGCTSCRFDYVGLENLACINYSYSPPSLPAAPTLAGLPGLTT